MIHTVLKLYEDRQDLTLSCFILNDQGALHALGARPAVLIMPGGAYLNCADSEGDPVALAFASMGYHAFVLHYSTYYRGSGAFPEIGKPLEPHPETQYPRPMQDIGKAILMIRAHAAQWLVDPDRIILCGFSAGAHNTAMYSNTYADPVITEYLHADAASLRPAGQILGYTLSDYVFMQEYLKTAPDFAKWFFSVSNTAYVGMPDPSEDILDQISPARHVSEKTCPTFLWATSTDHMVPVQHTLQIARALADYHVPFEVYIFGEGEHGISLASEASASNADQVIPDVAVWTDLCRKWLKKWAPVPIPKPPAIDEYTKTMQSSMQ